MKAEQANGWIGCISEEEEERDDWWVEEAARLLSRQDGERSTEIAGEWLRPRTIYLYKRRVTGY